ncbi:hypothetical protein [Marinibactrum halimedae]|uniref:GLUG domain-containing protein n=1 Tax=Marinibactrum halimedae TaxID=1444977 RepID=A0AA37WNB7_9GAMM|nr:hypothetical protein [Marinibactrum halimedae]MCD9460937.1 hypothetical protein [Marinibactrum halimedae]GLS27408.1 hypothetical protein GCM10007877_31270 [Marinibactrum halimedae]
MKLVKKSNWLYTTTLLISLSTFANEPASTIQSSQFNSLSSHSTSSSNTSSSNINIDQDGDYLIDISTLEQLDWVRNNLDGTSLVTHTGEEFFCSDNYDPCEGYELTNNLSFDTNNDGLINEEDDYFDMDGDQSNKGWRPIGTSTSGLATKFYGNGYRIQGFYINRPEESYLGLFARIEAQENQPSSSSEVRRLTIETAPQGVTGKDHVGIIAGNAYIADNGNLFIGYNRAIGIINGNNYIGGMVGSISTVSDEEFTYGGQVTFARNYSELSISANDYIGGLVGALVDTPYQAIHENTYRFRNNTSEVTMSGNLNLGGIIGRALVESESFRITENHATVDITGARSAGGIIGFFGCYEETPCLLSDLTAEGFIDKASSAGGIIGSFVGNGNSSLTYSNANINIKGENNLGGLVGYLSVHDFYFSSNDSDALSVNNSYTTGFVSGKNNIGGLIGTASTSEYDFIDNNLEISKVFSTAKVIGQQAVGGLIGHANSYSENDGAGRIPTITNAYTSGLVRGERYVGGLVGIASVNSYATDFYNTARITNSYSLANVVATTNRIDTIGKFVGSMKVNFSTSGNYYQTDVGNFNDVGERINDFPFWPDELSGHLTTQLRCPESADNTTCSSSTLFEGWDESVWDFGNSTQFPGLIINGEIRRPYLRQ